MNERMQTQAKAAESPTLTPPSSGLLKRKCACGGTPGVDDLCAECRSKRLSAPAEPTEAPPIVHEVLRSPGRSLDAETRSFIEPRFGHDFSQVRVHADSRATASAEAVGALAYTVGQNVVFGAGRYEPGTTEGRRMVAHELTHVVQQRAFVGPPAGASVHPASALQEAEAERTARAVSRGESPLPIQQTSAPVLAAQQAPAMQQATTETASGAATRVLEALSRPDPIAGVGNPSEALAILRILGDEELVATLIEIDNRFMLDLLLDAIGLSDQTEVGAVIYAVRLTSPHGTADDQYAVQAARGLAQLAEDEQNRILGAVLARRGSGVSLAQLREDIHRQRIGELPESERRMEVERPPKGIGELPEGELPEPERRMEVERRTLVKITATVLAEAHPSQINDVRIVYYNAYISGGEKKACDISSACRLEQTWFKVWMTILDPASGFAQQPMLPSDMEKLHPTERNELEKRTKQPTFGDYRELKQGSELSTRAEAALKAVRDLFEKPSSTFLGWENQGNLADFNRNGAKDLMWREARQYLCLYQAQSREKPSQSHEKSEPMKELVKILGQPEDKTVQFMFNLNEVEKYLKEHRKTATDVPTFPFKPGESCGK